LPFSEKSLLRRLISPPVLDPRISYEGVCEDYPDLLADLEATKLNLHAHYIQHYSNSANMSHDSESVNNTAHSTISLQGQLHIEV